MHVLLTCKYKKDRIKKTTEKRWKHFFSILSQWWLSVAMEKVRVREQKLVVQNSKLGATMNSVPQFMSKVECDFQNYVTVHVCVGFPKSSIQE